jgi:chromosome segregation ATPase
MKLYRLAALQLVLLGCLPAPSLLAQRREDILSIQRDVAQLQDQVRTLQSAFDTKMTALTMTVQQSVDAANKANNAIAGLQGGIQEQMRQQGKEVVGPVANVGTKIDEMATAFQQVGIIWYEQGAPIQAFPF